MRERGRVQTKKKNIPIVVLTDESVRAPVWESRHSRSENRKLFETSVLAAAVTRISSLTRQGLAPSRHYVQL